MQIVFLNRLERTLGQEESRGQVFIGEMQGTWTAGWRNGHDGHVEAEAEDQVWYEGVSWEELLAAFRHGVAVKMKEGYRPLIDGMLDTPIWEREPSLPLLVQCYAEQQKVAPELEVALRQWRRAKAAEEKRTPYIVATNRELHMIAVFVPRTKEELGQIPGFGKLKTQRYAADLAALLQDAPRQHKFPLDWVAQAVDMEHFAEWMFRMKEEKYGRAMATAQENRKLLSAIREGKTLEELEALLQIERRRLVERIERLDDEGYDVLPLIERELSSVTQEEWVQASEAMTQLGDRYLKPLLCKLYGEDATAQPGAQQQYEKLRMMRIRYRRERHQADAV